MQYKLWKLIASVGLAMSIMSNHAAVSSEELLELSCQKDDHCQHFTHGVVVIAACKDAKCLCWNERVERVMCKPQDARVNNIIGGPCPCPQEHAECNNEEGICRCMEHYTASKDRRRCIPEIVQLGEACEQDEQCQASEGFSRCRFRSCKCAQGFIASRGRCIAALNEGNVNCSSSSVCLDLTENSECSSESRVCICSEDHVIDNETGYCLKAANYQEPCHKDVQCQYTMGPGALCSGHSICACDSAHYHPNVEEIKLNNRVVETKVTCKRLVVPGQYCSSHEDCYKPQTPPLEQTMYCYKGQCQCQLDCHLTNSNECIRSRAASSNFVMARWTCFVATVWALLSLKAAIIL